ncbi:hypothetical protein [Endozoicomonas elysicola]|uniref:Uncharacterized protein n=1 Tax=Endozoicomonas elysicola TaxID=305900 RepID=A0A081KEZ0_9GAMM|nr:hypothetical protein [Endozoicomonas elysicola]KEI72716.1 hypothetical protein GV64_20065 [Endozoicomonas elysicola]
MNNVNGVNTNNGVTTLNPAEMSQQDFIAAVYLERGEMLDSEVRRIIGEMDTSNQYVDTINTLIGKANVAEFGTTNYAATTWSTSTTANNSNVVLDNGYGLNFQPDGNGGTTFTILDAEGNQLIYQNQTLVPVPVGTTVDALEVGIPVMSDMTFILDDGTEITFEAGTPDTAFNSTDFSGGLADITTVTITRGNQGLTITGVDTATPTVGAPNLNGITLDANDNDGYILLEAGGMHAWEFNGSGTGSITQTNPNDANDQVTGYFARKLAFEQDLANEFTGSIPFMTQKEIDLLTEELRISYVDASGTGSLTQQEWKDLKQDLINARDNLNGNNQLQTVQLQRAMQTYNQNYEAMSNAQQKIYSLLKDIISNVK